jgi:glycolate oxidase FAD binding subunit
VYPLPTDSATVILTGDAPDIGKLIAQLLLSPLTPIAVDILSTALSQKLEISNSPSLVVKFATLPESIAQQTTQLLAMGKTLGLKGGTWQGEQETRLWRGIQTGIWGQTPIACKLGVRPTSAANTIAMLDRLTENTNLATLHISSGIGATTLNDTAPIHPLRTHCEAAGGFLSVLQAPPEVKQNIDVWGIPNSAKPLMQQLKQQFDPQGVLNPGRYF